MVPKTGMTISDYFQLAGIKRDLKSEELQKASKVKSDPNSFHQILTANGNNYRSSLGNFNTAAANPNTIGKSLTDYLNNRVSARNITSMPSVTKSEENKSKVDQSISSSKKKKSETVSKSTLKNKTSVRDRINASIKKAAQKHNLPKALIRSVIKAESNFDVHAVSPAGAQGLMQLMPNTAKELGVKDAFDIETNVDGGSRYLKQMLNQFNGNIKLALAAYNAGPGTVKKYGQIPPFRETQAYVQRVQKFMQDFS